MELVRTAELNPPESFWVLDSSTERRQEIVKGIESQGFANLKVFQVDKIERVFSVAANDLPDCLIVRYSAGLISGLCETFGGLPCPTVVVADSKEERAVGEALKAGVHDWVSRSRLSDPVFGDAIRHALVRYRLSQDLEHLNAELTRKDQIKSDFVSTATHELRTPLTAIVGLLALLQEEQMGKRARGLVSTMAACCDSLLLSVDDILDLTKIEAGEFVLYPSRFDPVQSLTVVASSLQPLAQDKGLILRTELPEQAVPEVTGDARRTRQILYNLASNALKYTERGRVTLRLFDLGVGEDGMIRLLYEVEDTGVGIGPEEQRRIFQKNYGSGQTDLRSRGTGLGLAIVDGIARRMGGRVGLRSRLGEGSKFWVELPFKTLIPQEIDEPESQERSLRILVAEDNQIIARVMDRQLRALGHIPTLAYDGIEALAVSESRVFDAVFLDARMPRMDGLTVARELRKRFHSKELPIVLLTAEAHLDGEVWRDAGFDECLVKPASPDLLRSVLSRLIPSA